MSGDGPSEKLSGGFCERLSSYTKGWQDAHPYKYSLAFFGIGIDQTWADDDEMSLMLLSGVKLACFSFVLCSPSRGPLLFFTVN